MREAVIVDAVRTAHGKRGGALASWHPVDLAAEVLGALVSRNGVDPGEVDDVILGCVTQLGDQSSNVARFAVLAAGWPEHVPGVTVNRACGSSQQALEYAANAILAGRAEMVVAGGVECMSRVPLGAARQVGMPYGPRVLDRYDGFAFNQGLSAEMIAEKWAMTREELDAFAVESHAKATAAIDAGVLESQIVPIQTEGARFDQDEGVRRTTGVEQLAKLAPSFKPDGVIHAGNSSQISDGASALLVTTPERARALGLAPIVRYRGGAVCGADPVLMLTGPIDATNKLLALEGLAIGDIDAFEVNEAFAPVPLAWLREVGARADRLNMLGGAIATGHPLGASGTSLMTRLVHHMRDNGLRYGLQTMCEGGGTANATLVELVA
jgi:acetyl-CoA acyltransferase